MRDCWTTWYICASFRQVLLLFRTALVMVLICVHENGLNLAFKKLHKEIHAHCNMSNNTEMYKENKGATLYSKIPSARDKHLFRQWVFIKYLLLGLGEIVVNKMDMLSALCDLGGCSDLRFLYIFFLLPHHYLKGRWGIKPHIFVTWFFQLMIGHLPSSHYVQIWMILFNS